MKKQFCLLLIAVFAISFSNSYGQALPGSAPRGTKCVDDALHPIAGKPYDYIATGAVAGVNSTQTGLYTWWATKDPNFLTSTTTGGVTTTTSNLSTRLTTAPAVAPNTDFLNAVSSNYGVPTAATPATGPSTVTITWSDAILSKTKYQAAPNINPTVAAPSPTFVSVWYSGGTLCTDNLKVYELDPIVAFTVDIRNINGGTSLAYDAPASQCIDIVRSATYAAGKMVYDYGTNVFYYEVIAANFTDSWTPTFTLTGLHTSQTSVIEWTYDKPATWGAATVWNNYTTTPTTKVTTTETNTTGGVSIYVRLTVTNHNYEGIADRPITLAVDGQNSVGVWDIINDTNTCSLASAADQNDKAIQNLTARPAITAGTTSPITTNIINVPGNEAN
jgi:hypothetical protein